MYEPTTACCGFLRRRENCHHALDRLDLCCLSPVRAERHGFEYYRHGTLSLYAALDVKKGKVQGKTAKRHTSDEFVAFLDQVVASASAAQEIHIVLDNLSAHKTLTVAAFLERNPRSGLITHLNLIRCGRQSRKHSRGSIPGCKKNGRH